MISLIVETTIFLALSTLLIEPVRLNKSIAPVYLNEYSVTSLSITLDCLLCDLIIRLPNQTD